MKFKIKAFTLVELIIVITILSILWTIAFISLQGYSLSARDTVRVSDIKNIEQWIWAYFSKSWIYPIPENPTTITASGANIRYQWIAGSQVLWIAWLSWIQQWSWKDPSTWKYYTYITDGNNGQYEIQGNFETLARENKFQLIPSTYAIGGNIVRTYGSDLWIVFDSSNRQVQEAIPNTSLDIRNLASNYNVVFNQNDQVNWTGWQLFNEIYYRDVFLIKNKSLAQLDNSIFAFWDMETSINWGSQMVMKDFSNKENNIGCYNALWIINCWPPTKHSVSEKNKRKYLLFDGVENYLNIASNSTIQVQTQLTISAWVYPLVDLKTFKPIVTKYKSSWISKGYQLSQDIWTSTYSGSPTFQFTLSGNGASTDHVEVIGKTWEWQFIVITFNGWLLKMYVNGELKDSKTSSITSIFDNGPIPINIATNEDKSSYFLWGIDDIRMYNRNLSDNEIKSIYQATTQSYN